MKQIYLDYQASTPCSQEIIDAMVPYFTHIYGNPHSRSHSFGWNANQALEQSREQIAKAINANSANEIIFTSGATESNNLAIKGLAQFWKDAKKHIITLETEHKCMFEAIKELERQGWEITYIPVDANGLVDIADIQAAIRPDTLCIALSAVNHEIGAIQPIEKIGAIAQKHNVFFIVDAAQALGKITIDAQKWQADLISLSAHKVYGPKGVGCLFVRTKPKRVRLAPLNHGGGQERNMRSGTMPTPLIVGFGKACELYANTNFITKEWERVKQLHLSFIKGLSELDHIYLNGPSIESDQRIPHNVNISIAGIEGESLMMEMPNLAFSSGSACTSANLEPSAVLVAIGMSGPNEDLLHSSVRISFGQQTTLEDIEIVTEQFVKAIKELRAMSPVWEEIIKNGVNYKGMKLLC